IELFEIALRIPPWETLRPLSKEELGRLRVHNADSAFGGPATPTLALNAPAPVTRPGQITAPSEAVRGWIVSGQGRGGALMRRHRLPARSPAAPRCSSKPLRPASSEPRSGWDRPAFPRASAKWRPPAPNRR